MANSKKHMERSHRSYHDLKPFATFAQKAAVKEYRKQSKTSIVERMKALFRRTTNK